MYKLYSMQRSGNSYKVRLALALLNTPYEAIEVDILRGESRTPEFLAKNPSGQVPLLEVENGRYLAESNAILWYVCGGTSLAPESRVERAEALLARSEAQLSGIVESAMDAIITVDESQRVVMFNPAAERMFGYSRREALGAPMSTFLPDRFRETHADHVRRFGETGVSSRRMGALRVVTGLRRSGEEFPLDASISLIGMPPPNAGTAAPLYGRPAIVQL